MQVMIQQTYSNIGSILYFVPIVFIGSFFLLNLTLAVINSKFTEASKLQENEAAKQRKDELSGGLEDDQIERSLGKNDEMSIA